MKFAKLLRTPLLKNICELLLLALRYMRNEENIGHTVRGKRAINSLSLMCKISIAFYQGSKKKQNNSFLVLVNN